MGKIEEAVNIGTFITACVGAGAYASIGEYQTALWAGLTAAWVIIYMIEKKRNS